jgi:metal-sulfur cluster biosynthetic enzyme
VERRVTAAVTEASVRAVLNTIVDPCSRAAGAPAGLADMGLIRQLEVTRAPAGARVRVVIGVTEYACLIGPSFAAEAHKKLTPLPGVAELIIELDGEFDWDPDDMSPSYRELLARRRRQGNAFFLPLRELARPGGEGRP